MLKNEPENAAPNTEKTDDSALLARRRLLKLGAYVPPAIVGMAVLGSMPGSASAHGHHGTVGSCMPSACQPCVNENSGDNDGGDKNGGDKNGGEHGHHHRHHSERDHRQCQIAKEKKKHEKHGRKHHNKKRTDNKKNSPQAPTIPGTNREKSAWPFF